MPPSFEERYPNLFVPSDQEIEKQVSEMEFDEPGSKTDQLGRLEDIEEMKEVEKIHEETAQSVFTKLKIVADEQRAKALASVLRGKTPPAVIKVRKGRGGKEFHYVEGWYVKKMLNALFAMQWDFELVPIKEGELYHMTARQVIVMGKLTIRDIDGKPRIVKMGMGKKEIAYEKTEGKQNITPMDLGNDIKAAETDALKRCATALGIALDLYSRED